MKIEFKDFVPELLDKGGFFAYAKYESLVETKERLNHWILESEIDVVNVETIILPNIYSKEGEMNDSPQLETGEHQRNYWNQIFRVWYKTEKP